MTLRDKVASEIDGIMDNSVYDCTTNRAVATDRIMALFEEERQLWKESSERWSEATKRACDRAEKAEARVKELREALEESVMALRRAWEMFDAICKNDPSTDRLKARDRAWNAHVAASAALKEE